MSPPRIWKRGERCRVTAKGAEPVVGVVEVAAASGRSLALLFDALWTHHGLHVNGAALLWDDGRAAFVELRTGEPFELAEVEP